jgi:predicted alpha-1,6-mannanase (GH76 family)
LFNGANWWNNANGLTAIIDKESYRSDGVNSKFVADAISHSEHYSGQGYIVNEYNDDQGWWGLAMIRAYELLKNSHYLDLAEAIWNDMDKYWSSVCSGGIYWKKDTSPSSYKASIANELYLALGAKLHLHRYGTQGSSKFLTRSEDTVAWFLNTNDLIDQGVVRDGVNPPSCSLNNAQWTYNSGVIVGGLISLFEVTGKQDYLTLAENIAFSAMKHFQLNDASHGNGKVLIEVNCETNPDQDCGADGVQFKGVYVRNLGYLHQKLTDSSKKSLIQQFINNNVISVVQADVDPMHPNAYTFGARWSGPFKNYSPQSQFPILDLFAASLLVNDR